MTTFVSESSVSESFPGGECISHTHTPSACSKVQAGMQRRSRRRKQAPLHRNCISTSLKRAPFRSTGVHVHADTSTMQKTSVKLVEAGCTLHEKKEGKTVMQ